MKGIAFHWEPPYKDVYSGMDPMADAWTDMAQAFGLKLAIISPDFPAPSTIPQQYTSFQAFMLDTDGETKVFANYSLDGESASLDYDWLVIGPSQGWSDQDIGDQWKYPVSPGGGWHCLHLAHLACASTLV